MSELHANGLLTRQRRLHFVGIGGAGMSGIAELCLKLGMRVSGCDLKPSAAVTRLAELGAEISQGHHPAHLKDEGGIDALVISSAIKFSNPEVARAREMKIPVIALIMEEANLDPTVAVGGNIRNTGSNVRLGRGDFMVAEADESDASFLLLIPTIAVVTNIDPEHLDHYGTMDRVLEAFGDFINRVPFYGVAVLGIDSVNVRGLTASIRKPMVTYGVAPDADLRAEKIVIDGLSTRFEVIRKGENLGRVTIPTPGVHVALNSLAAIAVAMEVGISFEVAAAALAKFGGISRRFEIKGEAAGRIVLDDYAHHPAEVRATLAAVRAAFKRRVVAVFQPHRYTRLRDLFDDFLSAFDDADVLYLFDVYPAGEDPIAEISSRRLYQAMRARGHLDVRYVGGEDDPAGRIASGSRSGDVIATLGAGDIYKTGGEILNALNAEVKVHEGA